MNEPSEAAVDAALNVTPERKFIPAQPYGGSVAPELSRDEMRVALRAAYAIDGLASRAGDAPPEEQYPCADCGKLRTKAEGGTVFTVCEECWDKHWGASRVPVGDAPLREAALTEFFWRCWDSARGHYDDLGELDGGDIQEWGVKAGLLKKVVADAPCGEGCVCEEYVGDDFPTDCYRPTVARAASPVPKTTESKP